MAKAIKKDCAHIEYDNFRYNTQLLKEILVESAPPIVWSSLQKLTPQLDTESLPAILIGNIITSVSKGHSTPFK